MSPRRAYKHGGTEIPQPMATEPRQRPPGPFSGRFILVILGLVVAYMLAMWFA
jgi:hypothetical protein